ncbi:hypothetical protein [Arthrobacter woluwensis]|uniref:hypothetical protein n=1 Tax=Arthrobacter woluwensis TaxID=156980 RepID=UPI003821AA97
MSARKLRAREAAHLTGLHLKGLKLRGFRFWAAWPGMYFITLITAAHTYTDGVAYLTITPPLDLKRTIPKALIGLTVYVLGLTALQAALPLMPLPIVIAMTAGALLLSTALLSYFVICWAVILGAFRAARSAQKEPIPRPHWKISSLVKDRNAPLFAGLEFAEEAIRNVVPPGAWLLATARSGSHVTAYQRMGMTQAEGSNLMMAQPRPSA